MRLRTKTAAVILSVLLALLFVFVSSLSCQNGETASSQTTTNVKSKSFIWEISSDSTHVYLLGSVHVASQDLYPLNNSIEDAFNSSTYLVVEVNTDNLTPDEANQLLMDYGMYAQGEGFKENVSEELYSKLNEQFQAYGIGLELLNDFKPFVIYNMFSQFILESLGYQAKYGVDVYFLERAKISNKTILELETMEFQFSLLSSIPDESIIMGMQYDVDNPETEKYLQDLFDAWITGDPDKMEVIVFEALVEEPGLAPYYEIMYDQRNLSMAQKIEEFLADEAVYFIIVGAGHLVGENGLINLLKNRGYIVEQL